MPALTIRPARADDATEIAAIYAPFVTDSVISLEFEAPTATMMAHRIAETMRAYPWLVAEDEGRIAGYVYASQHRTRAGYQWSADVTAYMADGYRGRGLGRALYGRLFEILRLQGYRSLYAGITMPNEASVALHAAMGMEPVGIYRNVAFKLGMWRDTVWMGLSFDDDGPPGGAAKPFAALPREDIARILSAGV